MNSLFKNNTINNFQNQVIFTNFIHTNVYFIENISNPKYNTSCLQPPISPLRLYSRICSLGWLVLIFEFDDIFQKVDSSCSRQTLNLTKTWCHDNIVVYAPCPRYLWHFPPFYHDTPTNHDMYVNLKQLFWLEIFADFSFHDIWKYYRLLYCCFIGESKIVWGFLETFLSF